MANIKPKIFCFINGGSAGMYDVAALAQDGAYLAGHLSSSRGWAKHDIGIDSDWKHEIYKEHYQDGYELVWIDNMEDPELLEAVKKNNKN